MTVTSHQLKKKKKKDVRSDFKFPRAPPNPTTHHSQPLIFTLSISLFGWLIHFTSFLSLFFHSLIHSSLLLCPLSSVLPHHHHFHHHFLARSPENSWEPINTFTSFFEVKISNFFGGFYIFAYLSFNNDTHVVYEHWKWYLCVCMYGFYIGGIIWWVGIWIVLMMTT